MLMNNFLGSRKSVRHFKSKSISKATVEKINNLIRVFNSDKGNSFAFHENGKAIYDGLNGHAGYNGVMISAPSYISVDFGASSDREKVIGMYNAEDIITFLESEGLGSCWIGLFDTADDIKTKVFGNEHKANLLLAIGYPKARNPFVVEEASERKPVDEIVFDGSFDNPVDINMLEQRGLDDLFYYVKFAPNTLNSQTWRFLMKNNSVELYLKEFDGKYFFEDAGIIMYYFERLYNMTGFDKKFEVEKEFKEENGIIKIATINL